MKKHLIVALVYSCLIAAARAVTIGDSVLQSFSYRANALLCEPMMPIAAKKQDYTIVMRKLTEMLESVPRVVMEMDYDFSNAHYDIINTICPRIQVQDFDYSEGDDSTMLLFPPQDDADFTATFEDWIHQKDKGKLASHYRSLLSSLRIVVKRLLSYRLKLTIYHNNYPRWKYANRQSENDWREI